MKRSFLGIIFLMSIVVLASCKNQNEVNPNTQTVTTGKTQTITPASLPLVVRQAVNKDFSGQSIIKAMKETGSQGGVMYKVTVADNQIGSYSATGEQCPGIDIATLPQAIKDYVAKNHAGATITTAFKFPDYNGTNVIMVGLSNDEILTFDEAGNFLNMDDCPEGMEDHDFDDKIDSIAVTALPAAAQTYITANYAGQTITAAYKVTIDGTNEIFYAAELSSGVEVVFDANGKFLMEEKDMYGDDDHEDDATITNIAATDLPATAQTYISTNFAGKTITKAYKATFKNGTIEYGVELNDGTDVYFDASGNFMKDEMDDDATETAITVTDLPAVAQTYLTTNYAGKDCNQGLQTYF